MSSRLLRVVQTLASPPVLEFWSTLGNRTWSLDRPLARVVARREASADAVSLVLQPNRHWQGFAPGQHVNLTVEVDGRRLTRSYSPSPVPGHDGHVEITVKAVPGGRVSQHLCRALAVGDVVELGPAYGEMRAPVAAPSVLLAAGSGITPMIAMLRALAAQGMPQPVTLVYWARTRAELCNVAELRKLARRWSNLQVHFALTSEPASLEDEVEGRIGAATLALLGDVSQRQVFACGPAGFVEAAQALLGGTAQAFLAEAFTPPAVAATGELGTVRVTLTQSGRTLEIARGKPLLEALEAQGLKPAYGCRMGLCNTCACGKRAGTTRHLHTGEVEAEPASALRLCVTAATSDLVIEL